MIGGVLQYIYGTSECPQAEDVRLIFERGLYLFTLKTHFISHSHILEKFRLEAKAHELLYELHSKISPTASCWGLSVHCQQSLIGPQ